MKVFGYIFLFYVGIYFYRLAEIHNKNKWLLGFIGIILFLMGYFSYLLFCRVLNSQEYNMDNLFSIGIKAFFTGFFTVIIMFQILNFVWNKKKRVKKEDIDKIGK